MNELDNKTSLPDLSREELALLLELGERLVSELNLEKVLKLVAEAAYQVVHAETLVVPIIDSARQSFTYRAASGKYAEMMLGKTFPIHEGACGWVMGHQRPLLFGEGVNFDMEAKACWQPGMASSLLVPLICRGTIAGGLSAMGKQGGGAFNQRDLTVLTLFANQASIAIDNAKLFHDLDAEEARLRASEQRYRTLFNNAEVAMFRTRLDGSELLDCNDKFLEIVGRTREEIIGKPSAIFWENQNKREEMVRLLNAEGRVTDFEFGMLKTNGELRHCVTSLRLFREEGLLEGSIRDITEYKQSEDALRQAATVFESSHDGAVITDLAGRILAVNRAYMEITGYSEAEMLGQNPRMFHSGRHSMDFYQRMWANVKEAGYWQGEIWNRRKNGEIYPERLTISAVKNASGEITHYVGMSSDLSQLKQSETQLEHLAHYDPLTDMPNRLLVQSHLTHTLAQAQRQGRQVGVLYLDLDRFKSVNESLGYPVGDELLVNLTKRLTSRLRSGDMLARLGGDEFLLVMEHMEGPEDVAGVARSLLELLTQPFDLSGNQEVFIGASIGISVFPDDGSGANQLIQHADAAMHQAKKQGRNTYSFYTDSLTHAAGEHFKLETRLRHAITANQLRVYYQPQIDIATGHIIGAEALVRWLDPERGLIPPVHFIPLAEETGLINAIGEYVLRETCLQGVRWIEAGLPFLTLAVNLSPHQFMRGNIAELVSKVLAETGFKACRLELELTESALMDQEEEAVKMLHLLRAQDIRLAIDDFGTGYSSLAYLKRFPLDILKIDKSFVDDIPFHQDDMEIAATIIAMGHTLGFKVLAEGVETVEQLAFLQAKGCDMYQGYLTSPPVPPEEFEKLLKRK